MKINGRWFLQLVDWDSGNLYPIYPPFPCSDLLSQGWAGGGGIFFCLKYLKMPLHLLVKWDVVSPNRK